jgi:hypothetical protein
MLQTLDTTGRTTSRDGLPAPGHPPARLRAEEPKQEYKREAFEMFSAMLGSIKHDVVTTLSLMQVRSPEELAPAPRPESLPRRGFQFKHEAFGGLGSPPEPAEVGADAGAPPRGADGRQPAARSSPTCATTARSGATSPAPAAPARSTSSATARWPDAAMDDDLWTRPTLASPACVWPPAPPESATRGGTICAVMALRPGQCGGRLHPQRLLRRAGAARAPHLAAAMPRYLLINPATPTPAPAPGPGGCRGLLHRPGGRRRLRRRRPCCPSPPA